MTMMPAGFMGSQARRRKRAEENTVILGLVAVRNDDLQLKAAPAAQGITVNAALPAARAPVSVPPDAGGASRKNHP